MSPCFLTVPVASQVCFIACIALKLVFAAFCTNKVRFHGVSKIYFLGVRRLDSYGVCRLSGVVLIRVKVMSSR